MDNSDKIVITDIDGTLANIEHRRKFVRSEPKNWRLFNEYMKDDSVNSEVVDVYNAMRLQGFYMVIFTGRSDEFKDVTIEWLKDNNIIYDELHMRSQKNEGYQRDSIVKNRMLSDLASAHPYKSVYMAIDDRPQVCNETWVENGVFLFDVGQRCEDF